MLTVVRIVRVAAILFFIVSALLTVFGAWGGISDLRMQHREHWEWYCYDIWFGDGVIAFVSVVIAGLSVIVYRKSTAWERRLHGSQTV